MGLSEGLEYVYTGNIWGSKGENTYCPRCGETLIIREGLELQKFQLNKGKCPSCNLLITGKFY